MYQYQLTTLLPEVDQFVAGDGSIRCANITDIVCIILSGNWSFVHLTIMLCTLGVKAAIHESILNAFGVYI